MILSVSRVKNSADIIESFIRYNANIVDQFLITDANSTDRTIEILDSLKKEGYPIEVFSTDELAFSQGPNNTRLLQYGYNNYHPDYILPLDDDEFIVPTSGSNLSSAKDAILNLPKDKLYFLLYQTYYSDPSDNPHEIDPLKRMNHYYPSTYGISRKTLLPAELVDSTTQFSEGCHLLSGSKIHDSTITTTIELAHYPCRSYNQALSKILIGKWSFLAYTGAPREWGIHYTHLYNEIKNDEKKCTTIVNDLVRQYVINGAQSLLRTNELIGNNLSLKYTTSNEFNLFQNIAEYVESIIQQLLSK